MFEKPPAERSAAVSGTPWDAPTEVTKGQPEGKVGTNDLQVLLSREPETPPSPEEKSTDTPRAPSWAYVLYRLLWARGESQRTGHWEGMERAHCATLGEMWRSSKP